MSECDNGKHCLKISFEEQIFFTDIVSVRLWVFRRKKDLNRSSTLTVSTKQRRHGGKYFNKSHTMTVESVDGWLSMQLRVDDIIHQKTPSAKSSKIEVNDGNIAKFHAILKCDNCEFMNKKNFIPFIAIDTVTRVRQIRRRSVSKDECSGGCCRKAFKVNFKDLGWDFVYYPLKYNAYYCQGSCYNNTGENKAKDYLFTAAGVRTKYCCSPKSFSSLNIFYMQGGSLIRRRIPDIVVKECRCV